MNTICRISLLFCFASGLTSITAAEIEFNRDIRPILSENCLQCHGPDAQQRQADLRLDVAASATMDRDGFRVVHPGKADSSELIARVTSDDDDLKMPPPATGKRLTARQVQLLKTWINQGGKFERHWSLLTPRRPSVPPLRKGDKAINAIDHFVLSALQARGQRPNPPADRATLIRRLSLDLTGLPPTVKDVRTFLSDRSENAYEKVVDRLLRSARYGEHMARYWLDAARYADTNGYQYDLEREQWVWRDWVINALNKNMPFDQFTIQQLAGDLLPNATDQQKLATAFHRNHPITIEGGVIDEEYRTEYVVDRVVTTSTIWLGSTLVCSRCHDHKYDPFSQQDFYRFFAFFNQVPERGNNGFNPKLKIASPLQSGQLKRVRTELAAAKQRYTADLIKAELSFAELEKRYRSEKKDSWRVAVPSTAKSTGGAEFQSLPDGSRLASGKNAATDTYEFVISLAAAERVAGVRLEALKHPSLVKGGGGRGSNGNYVLTEFQVEVARSGDKFERLKLASAEADYAQNGYPIRAAIDGKVDRLGWAVDGHIKHDDRIAAFWLAKPLDLPKGVKLRIRMIHNFGLSHQIGRVRFSLANQKQALTAGGGSLFTRPDKQLSPDERRRKREILVERFGPAELKQAAAAVRRLESRVQELGRGFPATMVMQEMAKKRATHVLFRGQYDQPRDKVVAGTPAVFPAMPKGAPANRLGLARWLVMPSHPLTSRVTVNRFWQRLFGRGIVSTIEDFGSQGAWPTHPELLDWLAVEFVEKGWDVKGLLKTIVMSATYRQSSGATRAQMMKDPENVWLARGPRYRLDAEVIRDSALFVSGQIVDQVGGPSVFPYHPQGLWQEINNRPGYSRTYKQDRGSKLYRRSLYTFWKRTVPPPSMATFDAPEREFCVVRRSRTNTPLQAFILLHDPQFVEAARHLGARMIREGGATVEQRLTFGFQACMARKPTKVELQTLQQTLRSRLARYGRDANAAEKLLRVGESSLDSRLDSTEWAAYTTVARVLLNLAEFISKN